MSKTIDISGSIPKSSAVAIIIAQSMVTTLLMHWQQKQLGAIIADQNERIRIFDETTKFLIENADDRTLTELNEKLDFWRVIRGQQTIAQD